MHCVSKLYIYSTFMLNIVQVEFNWGNNQGCQWEVIKKAELHFVVSLCVCVGGSHVGSHIVSEIISLDLRSQYFGAKKLCKTMRCCMPKVAWLMDVKNIAGTIKE